MSLEDTIRDTIKSAIDDAYNRHEALIHDLIARVNECDLHIARLEEKLREKKPTPKPFTVTTTKNIMLKVSDSFREFMNQSDTSVAAMKDHVIINRIKEK